MSVFLVYQIYQYDGPTIVGVTETKDAGVLLAEEWSDYEGDCMVVREVNFFEIVGYNQAPCWVRSNGHWNFQLHEQT